MAPSPRRRACASRLPGDAFGRVDPAWDGDSLGAGLVSAPASGLRDARRGQRPDRGGHATRDDRRARGRNTGRVADRPPDRARAARHRARARGHLRLRRRPAHSGVRPARRVLPRRLHREHRRVGASADPRARRAGARSRPETTDAERRRHPRPRPSVRLGAEAPRHAGLPRRNASSRRTRRSSRRSTTW